MYRPRCEDQSRVEIHLVTRNPRSKCNDLSTHIRNNFFSGDDKCHLLKLRSNLTKFCYESFSSCEIVFSQIVELDLGIAGFVRVCDSY